ncbi:MAG: hypothetical protein KDD61_02370 [Bdellovibrionales bacterium]|nr:hypothetical protein [Bdellovibrionales bacterium]
MIQSTLLSKNVGWLFLFSFGIVMILLTLLFTKNKHFKSKEGFLLANRSVVWWLGGPSIAASWIWAGALFVSVQQSYQQGLPGLFWFLLPNVIALLIFVFLGPRIRTKFKNGYTLPQWIHYKLQSNKVHKLYLFPFFFNQLVAITFNIFAGATMIYLVTGIHIAVGMPVLVGIALVYSLISGLNASIITDFVQMTLILIACFLIVPWAVYSAGGLSAIVDGLGGVTGEFRDVFNPSVAFSFGIVTSIGLISQTVSDQQFWQRCFALKEKHIAKAFIFGALLFGIVPLLLSLLGFLGANPNLSIQLPPNMDPSMIGISTASQLLPLGAVMIYVIALLGALSSTIDSGIAATASLYSTDVVKYSLQEREAFLKKSLGKKLSQKELECIEKINPAVLKNSRYSMIVVSIVGLLVAYGVHYITAFGVKHLFLISISVVACVSVPTVLSLYWDRLDPKGVFWGVLIAFVVGLPNSILASHYNNSTWNVLNSLFMIGISTLFCLIFSKKVEK